MKKPGILYLILLASLFSFPSCEDLLDVKETFTFEYEFHVTSEDLSFLETAIIDMSEESSLIEDYGSKIKKIEILNVSYWLTAHEGSETQQFNSLSLDVANADGSDAKNIANLQNVVLSPLMGNPADLQTNAAGVEKLSALIKAPPHQFYYMLSGSVNEIPVNFRVVFELEIRMTANPL